ncbi:uncharacterized protein LOC124372021 [Homalodisca vitripennis]|uniref:uncharacterized protein LOC124371613 n=1 Tax=Homalodisca vitripennis TaxID=197043 RepID=UPI001EEA90DD|nr:uncharacterized protein LOC124371613 [Homalodisca vitripennis]XP_046685917.1 uncharacterized protein LOC124371614 [Homalodisca vitripennis]XP_046685918.1 uncharacterized protein LOC124371615 [Homalodisca vitripennis]XP_046685919.1 uncharacterized protein LOC124371616 [Homalodisca vitripennis]XP_046685920.1 uncharacterized protein LOC124371618 [Homalodisca vitripennis]XP_046685921.1 uncharacterized protein LOC124371619 [Homalodisca vitripennis]XP_046685922.1 uncharacterized protein LOC12437
MTKPFLGTLRNTGYTRIEEDIRRCIPSTNPYANLNRDRFVAPRLYRYTPTSVLPAPHTPLLIVINNFHLLLTILGDVKSIHGFPFTSRKFFSANTTLQAQEPTNL